LSDITDAVSVLQRGGVLAHATEGVWGLACDPLNYSAVQRILNIKARSEDKGLLLLGASSNFFAAQLKVLNDTDRQRIENSWPGHVTWILPDTEYPSWVSGGRPTIACRVPDHAQARAIAEKMGRPIVSTSLNLAGEQPLKIYADAVAQFAQLVDLVLPGEIGDAQGPSKILQLEGTGTQTLR
jgi:L-threonylcarbamoyladenylate synthase|tara:strand:- start:6480 stop:7028 length:549 start_codon:yes stop_codon:yes gene_type:complete